MICLMLIRTSRETKSMGVISNERALEYIKQATNIYNYKLKQKKNEKIN